MIHNKILLFDGEIELIRSLEEQITVDNVATYCRVANICATSNVSQLSLYLIERCSTSVLEANNFLELNYKSIAKIQSSSELNIDIELQVFNAAESCLKYNTTEHLKFVKSSSSVVIRSRPEGYFEETLIFK